MKIPIKYRVLVVSLACILLAVAGVGLARKYRSRRSAPQVHRSASPEAWSINVSPNHGELAGFYPNVQPIRVTFLAPMVPLENVRRGGQPSPIIFDPVVEARWIWVSQTEGKLSFPQQFVVDNIPKETLPSARIGRVLHRAKLRPGLCDLTGKRIDSDSWGIEFSDSKFALKNVNFLDQDGWYEEEPEPLSTEPVEGASPRNEAKTDDKATDEALVSRSLDAPLRPRPKVRLEFSHDVNPAEVRKAIYFQDNKTKERFPIEVNLEERQSPGPQGWVIIEPAQPLPLNRTFLLVVEAMKQADSKESLPNLRVIPAGTTVPLQVEKAVGLNQPGKGIYIRVETDGKIDPDPTNLKRISVTPTVSNLEISCDGDRAEITGAFDASREYRVKFLAGLKAVDGSALEKDSSWRARFRPKRPAIVLPEEIVFQRAAASAIRCSFVQVNTAALEWKIARLSRENLAEAWRRLREFEEPRLNAEKEVEKDPITGEYLYQGTDLLIPQLNLPVVAFGQLEESGNDIEMKRVIEWVPPDHDAGIYLLEINGKDLRGRDVGNRIIISRGDWMVSLITTTAHEDLLRVINMNDGRPAPGLPVTFFDGDRLSAASLSTDRNGEVQFGRDMTGLDGARMNPKFAKAILVGPPGQEFLHIPTSVRFRGNNLGPANEDQSKENLRCVIVTDRNVYRPGETVKLKAFVRRSEGGSLSIPAAELLEWHVTDANDEAFYTGTSVVSATGDWEGIWQIPDTAFGEYFISALNHSVKIVVSEFRPLPFSVVVETNDVEGEVVKATIASRYFHGAPNAGGKVHWKAEWVVDDWRRDLATLSETQSPRSAEEGMVFNDKHSPDSPTRGFSDEVWRNLQHEGWQTARQDREVSIAATREGDAILDENGSVSVECKSPFPASTSYGRAKVFWIVDVTSESAETQRGGAVAKVQFVPAVLGVTLTRHANQKVLLDVACFDFRQRSVAGLVAKAELFRMEMKTVKEQISPDLNRYRNYPTFEKVWEREVTTPMTELVDVAKAGNYVVRVVLPGQPHVPHVSDAAMVEGWEDAEVAVLDESSLACKADRERYTVGDIATIAVQTPAIGVATVTVESDRVLFRQVFELTGNTQRVSIPVKPEFAPNAYVCVHLVKPVTGNGVPMERFGVCEIKVDRPEQRLKVEPILTKTVLEPKATVTGTVRVRSAGAPAAGADVLLFAVDEAVLALGRWALPNFEKAFFPRRPWEVETHSALGRLWNPAEPGWLTHSQKGFIIGDAGPLLPEAGFRRDFRALAFWNAAIRTNNAGEANFHFPAPEALTSYRVVAVVQRGVDQFGDGQAVFRLAKKLQVEPALPNFLRQGDEILLRTLVRQDYAEQDTVNVALVPGDAIEPLEGIQKAIVIKRGTPALVSFRARVSESADEANIGFAARSSSDGTMKDGQHNRLGVHPASLQRRQSISGLISRAQPFDVASVVPRPWLLAQGSCDVMLSGSASLPKLAGLPPILEARGLTEKLATHILAATVLADTLEYLPFASDKSLRPGVEAALKKLAASTLEDGGFSAWPSGGKLNPFSTVEAAWAIITAQAHGFTIDEKLKGRAQQYLERIIRKEIGFEDIPAEVRCFALMVYGRLRKETGIKSEENFQSEAEEIFAQRHKMNDEGRAWLALGSFYLGIEGQMAHTLLREIDHPIQAAEFEPATFSSKIRTEAICLFAQAEIESTNWSGEKQTSVRKILEGITHSSFDLSTQENFWVMTLFSSLVRDEVIPSIAATARLLPPPTATSKNGRSVGWRNIPLKKLTETFSQPLRPEIETSYLIRAVYTTTNSEPPPQDASLQMERTTRNLTAGPRIGTATAPFAVGDQILITYRLNANRTHSYVELEDQLPACLETNNPKLPGIAKYFQLPIESGVNTLALSHADLRFARTLLYFDKLPPGRNVYSILARVVAAGVFHWPGTEVRPLYDSRFSSGSSSMLIYASEPRP